MKVTGQSSLYLFLCLCGLVALACGSLGTFGPTEPRQIPVGIAVDPIFKEFYQTLGGQQVLGSPLTGQVERGGRKCQYVEAPLMCLRPSNAESSTHYQLEALGLDLQVRDDPAFPPPPNSGGKDLGGGYVLFDEFAPLYERLYGALYAGQPLTNLRVNRDTRRYEQFFTNVGFYRNFNDPAGQVHLIPYGAYTCGPQCAHKLDEYWSIVRSGSINQPFELTLQRLGWSDFGLPLSAPRLADDGMLEQVYEKAVLYAPLNDLTDIHLRPLILWMGIVPVQPPVEKNPNDQLVFYETENGLGHNVPVFFDTFIAAHGGRELAGKPITELFPVDNGQKYSQCFENYCLNYVPSAPDNRPVFLVDLGRQYLLSTQPNSLARLDFSAETIEMRLSEQTPQVTQGEQQTLEVQVLDRRNGRPLPMASGVVTVHIPDKPQVVMDLPPTDAQGWSSVVLQPLEGLRNMSVIEYEVCLRFPGVQNVCSADSFIYREK